MIFLIYLSNCEMCSIIPPPASQQSFSAPSSQPTSCVPPRGSASSLTSVLPATSSRTNSKILCLLVLPAMLLPNSMVKHKRRLELISTVWERCCTNSFQAMTLQRRHFALHHCTTLTLVESLSWRH